MNKQFLMLLVMLSFLSCKPSKDLSTVPVVDITKYAGHWYEIARFPNSFEKDFECVTATYTVLDNGTIEVINKGFSSSKKRKEVKGKAWVPDSKYPGRLKVQFFWPFSGDYYIVALDPNYNYALIGNPSRNYLWILSKQKELEMSIYNSLVDTARNNGFEVEKLVKINQNCN